MIKEIFNNICNICPNKTAVVFNETAITFQELKQRVDKLKCQFEKSGIGAGVRVGLLMDNSIEYVVSFFAIIATGATIVPFDSRLKAKEIDNTISFIEIPYVVTLNSDKTEVEIEKKIEFSESRCSEDEFLVQYGAGRNGKPKCVVHTNYSMKNICFNFSKTAGFQMEDSFLCSYILSSAHATMCILLPSILNGATLHIMDSNALYPRKIINYIKNNNITIYTSMPALYEMILETPVADNDCLKTLKFASAGGAPFSEEIGKRFYEKFGVKITNLYGKAETGIAFLNLDPIGSSSFASIGKPIENVEARIIRGNREAEIGEEGELQLRTNSVAKEVQKNEEEQSVVFAEDGWVATGDIVCKNSKGDYYIKGRVSLFINSGGNKISPYEIESVLVNTKLVEEAVVISSNKADSKNQERIVAFVVAKYSKELEKKLFEACSYNLADYKRVNEFVFVDCIERNEKNQIDREVLLKRYIALQEEK